MKTIKLFRPEVNWHAVWNAACVLRSGQLAEGPQVKAFEQEFADFFGFKDVITLNSGTAALEMAFDLIGINGGDEVITPILTAPATNIPLARRGAKIIFADIEDDLNMSVESVKKLITSQTKAVVFVHFNGNNRGLDELIALCEEKGIAFIEDAAQAVGTENWGKGEFVCMSFQAIKTFTTGDGGALMCKNPLLAQKARRLRWFGFDRSKGQTQPITEAGYKFHMNDIAAAIGRGNMKSLPKVIAHRKRLVEEYRANGMEAYLWRAFVLVENRDVLIEKLKAAGVMAGVYDNRNDMHPVFGGHRTLPNMDRLETRYLLLPLHSGVNIQDVRRIAGIIKEHNSTIV
jgi:perosamine synthetase